MKKEFKNYVDFYLWFHNEDIRITHMEIEYENRN